MGPDPFLEQSSAVKFPSLFEPPYGGMEIFMARQWTPAQSAAMQYKKTSLLVSAAALFTIARTGKQHK
jgi:hypothetical protein